MSFIETLSKQLEAHRSPNNAEPMSKYLKYKFPFLGIKSVLRKSILRKAISAHKNEVEYQPAQLAKSLYRKHEREYHYCAMELYARFKKKHYHESDIDDITYLMLTHSHWDTVDFIAKHILGQFLMEHQNQRTAVINQYSNSSNFWLNRAAILFQLAYRFQTDDKILFKLCRAHGNSNEFFIQKAIGWALREYSKIQSEAVLNFVKHNNLKPLSQREAIRLIT